MYELRASSEGTVIRVEVDEGQMVAEDDEIAVLETESGRVVVVTDVPGVVREIYVEAGYRVTPGQVVALLPAGARVIRPFLSGHGSDPARSASWEAELDRIFALIDDAGVERAHVCGYSLGGRLAWGLLARDPSRFSGATLVGSLDQR